MRRDLSKMMCFKACGCDDIASRTKNTRIKLIVRPIDMLLGIP